MKDRYTTAKGLLKSTKMPTIEEMGKPHDSEIVTRSAPQWAWDVIDETLACDANSSAFDKDLREEIQKAIEAMEEGE